MILSAFLIGIEKAIIDIPNPTDAQLAGNVPLKWEAILSNGYADVSGISNIDTHSFTASAPYMEVRNKLIADYLSGWATLSVAEKQALVRNYVYPSTETTANLDLLYTSAERDIFRNDAMKKLNSEPGNLFSVWKDIVNGKFYKAYSNNGVTEKAEITTYSTL